MFLIVFKPNSVFFQHPTVLNIRSILHIVFLRTYEMEKKLTNDLSFFAKVLRLRRFKCCLSQEKLAELADVHPNAIGRLERQKAVPSFYTIIKLARALKMSPKDFMPD